MRLILVDSPDENSPFGDALRRGNFYPLALGRPVWELRCGFDSLGEKLTAKAGADDVACFIPDYMADSYRQKTKYPVNDLSALKGDDLLVLNPSIKAESFDVAVSGPSEVGLDMFQRFINDQGDIEGLLAETQTAVAAAFEG